MDEEKTREQRWQLTGWWYLMDGFLRAIPGGYGYRYLYSFHKQQLLSTSSRWYNGREMWTALQNDDGFVGGKSYGRSGQVPRRRPQIFRDPLVPPD